jgi:8-oxo-dGTP pyrophosphatase MutT (NUDIX family)
VAGRVHREGRPHIDPELIRKGTSKVTALFSDNDYYIPLTEKDFFKESLGARVLVLHNRGHFSRKEKIFDLPEVLSEIKRMVYPKNRSVGVIVRGLPGAEELLVFERNYYGEKFFCLPGGNIEKGENELEALGRELQEELGIKIEKPEFLFEMDHEERKEFYFLIKEWQGSLENTQIDGNNENAYTLVWKNFKDLPGLSPFYPTESYIKLLAYFKLTP